MTTQQQRELGRKIYNEALYDRRGFRPDQMGIEDEDTWDEIYESIGQAAQAQQGEGEAVEYWVLFDATAERKYIKKIPELGGLAFFDSESEAARAKRVHAGTDYKKVTYYTHPQPAQKVPESLVIQIADDMEAAEPHPDETGYLWDASECAEWIRENAHRYATPAQQVPEGWIKCSERMPKIGERVILFSNGMVQHYMPTYDCADTAEFWDFDGYAGDDDPIVDFANDQWMPAPTSNNEDT